MLFLGTDIPLVMRILPHAGRLWADRPALAGATQQPRRIRIPGAIVGLPGESAGSAALSQGFGANG